MCGIAGWIDYKKDISNEKYILEAMNSTLKKRGPDDCGYYYSQNCILGHRRLTVVDPAGGAQPMIRYNENNKYIIVYNGELYNTEDIRKELINAGFSFSSYSDTEVLLTSYIYWGIDCLKHINGIFAFGIWDETLKRLFLTRDPLGVKPLFYTVKNDSLIFGSEIKALLAHPMIEPILDEDGLMQLFALGPARALGSGVLKDIYEVPPAYYLVYSQDGVKLEEYWKLKGMPHEEDEMTTAEHVQSLFIDAVKRQLGADVPICTFLSGGLDSSAISAIAAKEFKLNGRILDTYSIDYEGNDIYFKASEFQPSSDSVWARKMAEYIGSRHHNIVSTSESLAEALKDAVTANDMPGMADIDSSLLLFCREIRKNATVAISGDSAGSLINNRAGISLFHCLE